MEVLAALIGAGIVAASPFVPVLRPVAKAAIKGGLAVSEVVVGAATVVGQQANEAISKVKADAETVSADEAEAPEAVSQTQDAESASDSMEIENEKSEMNGQASGIGTLAAALRPTAQTAVKYGVALTDKAKTVAVAAGKQWGDLVAEAREAEAVPEAETVPEAHEVPEAEAVPEAQAIPEAEAVPEAQAVPDPEPDDLTAIRGLGPVTSGLLEQAGITTYAQLGATDEEQLRHILDDAGPRYRSIKPAGWPEQARQLAGKG